MIHHPLSVLHSSLCEDPDVNLMSPLPPPLPPVCEVGAEVIVAITITAHLGVAPQPSQLTNQLLARGENSKDKVISCQG